MGPAARFAALDFETADYRPDSACAVGVVVVENGRVATRFYSLIRPPRPRVMFTHIHGLAWDDLRDAPSFPELWPQIAPLLDGCAFVAAHNASFESRVLRACTAAAAIALEPPPFLCTVRLSRRVWGLYPTRLPDVCRALRIPLVHHRADSDAEACARIVIAASVHGAAIEEHLAA